MNKTASTQYGKLEFWERRYAENPKPFDWYQNYDGIKDIVTQFIKKDSNILVVGCGNSPMSERMYDEGYTNIINIDNSKQCIGQMQELYKDGFGENFKYYLMDCLAMEFESQTFDCVIDKGTLDTVLSGEYSGVNSSKMLKEINRVLKPKGVYICVTYGVPDNRTPILKKEEYDWDVLKYTIYKPRIDPTIPLDEKDLNNFHFIYVCRKGVVDPNTAIKRMSLLSRKMSVNVNQPPQIN